MLRIRDPNNPDRFLSPQGYQWDFATSPAFATMMSKAWGAGGSYAGHAFIDYSMLKSRPRSIGFAILPTYPHLAKWLNEQFVPAFRDIIAQHNKSERIFHFVDGRRMYYQSATDPQSLQITSADWAYLDEAHLMDQEIWKHVLGRVRGPRGVRRRVGVTSLPRVGWLSEEFAKPEYEGEGTAKRRIIYAETAWNRHLDPEYLENLRDSCPARMLDAYLRGRFVPAGGAVWPEFSEQRHVIPWTYDSRPVHRDGYVLNTGVELAIDWSPRNPHVQFWHRVPEGVRVPWGYTQHEIAVLVAEAYPNGYLQPVTTQRLCHEIKAIAKAKGYRLNLAVSDVAGRAAQSGSGESDMVIAQRELGIRVIGESQSIAAGISHVQWALDPILKVDKAGNPLNHPRLFIARDLVENPYDPRRVERSTFKALQAYSYPEIKRGRPTQQEPVKDGVNDHACDDTRYFAHHAWPQDRLDVDVWRAA